MERVAVGIVLVAAAFAFAVYTNRQDDKLDQAVADNAVALQFMCSTTRELDALVVQARDQIQASLDNGTYARLLKQGVITRENVRDAREVKDKYDKAHKRLRLPNACALVNVP